MPLCRTEHLGQIVLRIVIAEDSPQVLRQFISLLGSEFHIVGTAENGKSALECIRHQRPDVAVLDLQMPVLNAMDVTLELQKLTPSPAVVICSVETDSEFVEAALEAGAICYVFKKRMVSDLVAAVKCAARRETFVSAR